MRRRIYEKADSTTLPQTKALALKNIRSNRTAYHRYLYWLKYLNFIAGITPLCPRKEDLKDKIQFYPCGEPNTQPINRSAAKIINYANVLGSDTFNTAIRQIFQQAQPQQRKPQWRIPRCRRSRTIRLDKYTQWQGAIDLQVSEKCSPRVAVIGDRRSNFVQMMVAENHLKLLVYDSDLEVISKG